MNYVHLTQTLVESFNALADEVQSLIDRKTILEHKLRYAHEQYQSLADKYAPAVPEIAETLAKLQLPLDLQQPLATAAAPVPLPRRVQPSSPRHQIALVIREGRKAAQQLAVGMGDASIKGSRSSKETSVSPGGETLTSVSTVLEQDFTVEGRKGPLRCPLSANLDGFVENPHVAGDSHDLTGTTMDPTPHKSSDPICAAMIEETTSAAPAAGASKCPIRFLDKHSPEEIAAYVETHKHEIPRSHEVCVSRYQKNEEQIRKLDAKYGNLVSMINDLSHLHQPMLPSAGGDGELGEVDKASNKRAVEDWAQTVTASANPEVHEDENEVPVDEDRESHFDRDRPLRDVRVGESPSRPWGISVPLSAGFRPEDMQRQDSPPPAPVRMHSPLRASVKEPAATAARKCPFDFSAPALPVPFTRTEGASNQAEPTGGRETEAEAPFTPVKNRVRTRSPPRPTFVNPEMPVPKSERGVHPPQMVFNISGPVFIGYPMEQAIQFMQRFQGQ
ncbi:hypothetical protein B0T24DRAFT_606299 [Lasiosphaeria ovina]|uniref:Uncharacterized protein n=1 Tax=Lasiosphaeria ovina TaxID=92902 RepID=A0AAE0NLK5_9PEZI|nr:hypothetical protein B0T24DRAFT_606299 [Lasiosphaeria ovina]